MSHFIANNKSHDQESYAFSVIMPVYNEGPRIVPVVMTLIYTMDYPFELVVVYDKDDDPTIEAIRQIAEEYLNVRLVRNAGSGVINAIKMGIEASASDNIAVWCAYHVDPYGILNQMYELILEGCDIVSANRFYKIKRFNRGGLIKKILSRGGNFILWKLARSQFGDTTTSIKMYRRTFLKKNPIMSDSVGGWVLSTELALKASANGCKLGEVILNPYNINLIRGVSNFKVFKYLPHYIKWVLYGMRNRKKNFNNEIFRREDARIGLSTERWIFRKHDAERGDWGGAGRVEPVRSQKKNLSATESIK